RPPDSLGEEASQGLGQVCSPEIARCGHHAPALELIARQVHSLDGREHRGRTRDRLFVRVAQQRWGGPTQTFGNWSRPPAQRRHVTRRDADETVSENFAGKSRPRSGPRTRRDSLRRLIRHVTGLSYGQSLPVAIAVFLNPISRLRSLDEPAIPDM